MKHFPALCLFFLAGCASQTRIVSDYKLDGFFITQLKGSNIRLYVTSEVEVPEYKDSFEHEYQPKSVFDSLLTDQVKNNLSKYASVTVDTGKDMENIFSFRSLSGDNVAKIQEAFEKASENYFVGIKKIVITNDLTDRTPIHMSPDAITKQGTGSSMQGTGNSMMSSKKSENCIAILKIEVWSVKERKKLAEFTSFGRSTVFLLGYGRAIRNAVNYAVDHLSSYIEGSETE